MNHQNERATIETVSDREILIRREFRATAKSLYAAWTDPNLVAQWWAPKAFGVTMVLCEADVRVGGQYRYVIRTSEGGEIGFHGTYRELTPHARLVYTQVFEPMADAGEVIVTITLEQMADKTLLISRELYPSKDALHAAVSSGMEAGMNSTFAQLDELLSV